MEGNKNLDISGGYVTDAKPFGFVVAPSSSMAHDQPISTISSAENILENLSEQNDYQAAIDDTESYFSVNTHSENQTQAYSIKNFTITNASNFRIGDTYNSDHPRSKKNILSEEKNVHSQCSASEVVPRNIKVPKGIFDSNRQIDGNDIYFVAKRIGLCWRMLARKLPENTFEEGVLDALEYDYRGSLVEIVYQMLRKWKETKPHAATVGNLARTLFDVDHPDIVTGMKP